MKLCRILHSTKDYYGRISSLVPAYSEEDIFHYIKISLGNMYHEMCHRYIHADQSKTTRNFP